MNLHLGCTAAFVILTLVVLLDEDAGKRTGTLNASCRPKHLSGKYTRHVQMQELWNRTEKIVEKWL